MPPALSSLGVKPSQAAKSRPEFSGAKAAEAVPTPGMFSLESSFSFALLLGDLLNPCFSGAQGRRRQQRKLPDVGGALRSCNAELRDREAPSAAARLRACHPLPFPGLHGDERRAGRGFGVRVRRVVHA